MKTLFITIGVKLNTVKFLEAASQDLDTIKFNGLHPSKFLNSVRETLSSFNTESNSTVMEISMSKLSILLTGVRLSVPSNFIVHLISSRPLTPEVILQFNASFRSAKDPLIPVPFAFTYVCDPDLYVNEEDLK